MKEIPCEFKGNLLWTDNNKAFRTTGMNEHLNRMGRKIYFVYEEYLLSIWRKFTLNIKEIYWVYKGNSHWNDVSEVFRTTGMNDRHERPPQQNACKNLLA